MDRLLFHLQWNDIFEEKIKNTQKRKNAFLINNKKIRKTNAAIYYDLQFKKENNRKK
jgi:hypothetical protein